MTPNNRWLIALAAAAAGILTIVLVAQLTGSSNDPAESASAGPTSSEAVQVTVFTPPTAAPPTTTELNDLDDADTGPTTTEETPATPPTTTSEPEPREPPVEPPVDWLDFSRGATILDVEGLPRDPIASVLHAIDGDPTSRSLASSGTTTRVGFTIALPTATKLSAFSVPGVEEFPGNVTHFKNLEVLGASEPDGPYTTLLAADLRADEENSFPSAAPELPVRYVRVVVSGGLLIAEGQETATNLRFAEIVGHGTQEMPAQTSAFTGIWSFHGADSPDGPARLLELTQTGSAVVGCLGDRVRIQGTADGSVLKASGFNQVTGVESLFFLVLRDGDIQGVESVNRSLFGARAGKPAPEGASTPCTEEPTTVAACGQSFYVQFGYDSDRILPESNGVLADIAEAIIREAPTGFTVVGHTSTEGSADYNLDLSRRRAESVVAALADLGIDRGAMTAIGLGESSPLVLPETSEAERALNRRVTVSCEP